MYAVIATGGKQYRVTEGQRLEVERLRPRGGNAEEGATDGELSFAPVLVVDGETVLAGADALAGASVTARVVGEAAGPKIRGFTYKAKTNNRRHWGHRQHYSTIEITGISAGSRSASA
ncbi:MAG TPA: 50S ribosomal protein L21 [Acidimicrobiales bacterium]|nr:50S ribosomal protein L21 [Acidimicrobiales bacterium]